jgi:hypothetical protein
MGMPSSNRSTPAAASSARGAGLEWREWQTPQFADFYSQAPLVSTFTPVCRRNGVHQDRLARPPKVIRAAMRAFRSRQNLRERRERIAFDVNTGRKCLAHPRALEKQNSTGRNRLTI